MALFNFDFDLGARREKQEKDQLKKEIFARAKLSGANPTDEEIESFIANAGKIDSLAGVTGKNPHQDLQAELHNEELQRATEQNAPEVDRLRQSLLLSELGVDPTKIADSRESHVRTNALQSLLPELSGQEQANVVNKLDVSPVRSSGGVTYNRFDGTVLDESSALDALARERESRAGLTDLRASGLESILTQDGINPVLKADVANQRSVFKPAQVKVRMKDGREQHFNAIPNLQGSLDYLPVENNGEPVYSEPSAKDENATALQKDTAFIVDTLGVNANDALLMKLQSRSKSPTALWEDIVSRVVSSNRYADPSEIQQKSKELWSIMRPGQDLPTASKSAATDLEEEETLTDDDEFESDEAVREAFEAGDLSKEEAVNILRRKFGYQ